MIFLAGRIRPDAPCPEVEDRLAGFAGRFIPGLRMATRLSVDQCLWFAKLTMGSNEDSSRAKRMSAATGHRLAVFAGRFMPGLSRTTKLLAVRNIPMAEAMAGPCEATRMSDSFAVHYCSVGVSP